MEGERMQKHRLLKVEHYMTPIRSKQIGVSGQPEPHYLFHRSITDLFQGAFQNGFVISNIKEVIDPCEFNDKNEFALQNFPEIPVIMAASLVLQKSNEG